MRYKKRMEDLRWRRRRWEILERDNHGCTRCGYRAQSGLRVHHKYYLPGKEPWEYPDDALTTLCDLCHDKEHNPFTIAFKRLTGQSAVPA